MFRLGENGKVVIIKSLVASYKSWAALFGIIISIITGFRLYIRFTQSEIWEIFKPVIVFYDKYIGEPFNVILNEAISWAGISVELIYTDWIILYIVLSTVVTRPWFFARKEFLLITIISPFVMFLDWLKIEKRKINMNQLRLTNITKENMCTALITIRNLIYSVLLFICWVPLLVLLTILVVIFSPLIVVHGFVKPHFIINGQFYYVESFREADLEDRLNEAYIGDYRLMFVFSLLGFSTALGMFIVMNLLLG